MSDIRVKKIAFADSDVKKAFDELKEGKYEEKELFELAHDLSS